MRYRYAAEVLSRWVQCMHCVCQVAGRVTGSIALACRCLDDGRGKKKNISSYGDRTRDLGLQDPLGDRKATPYHLANEPISVASACWVMTGGGGDGSRVVRWMWPAGGGMRVLRSSGVERSEVRRGA